VSELVQILTSDEAAICQGYVQRLGQTGGPADERLPPVLAENGPALLGALTAFCRDGDAEPAHACMEMICHDAPAESIGRWVLPALRHLSSAIRGQIMERVFPQDQLDRALAQLDEGTDALRQCCFEAAPTGGGEPAGEIYQFEALVDDSSDFICLASLQGKPFFLNAAGRRLVGLGRWDDASTTTLRDFHPEEAWTTLYETAVPEVNQTGRWQGRSQLCQMQTGQVIDVETTMFLIRPPRPGKPACLAVVHRDCQGRRQIEESLGESEARKRAILESSLDPIVTINHEGRVTEFNRAAEAAFGHTRDEVLGKEPSEILFPESKIAGHHDRVERYLSAGDGSMLGKRSEVVARRADGELFPAEMAMTLSQEQGQPVLTFFLRDISDRKQAEKAQAQYAEALERSNRELGRSNKELEQFAYVASHDLQEPLRKIRTFSDRLEMKYAAVLDDTGRELVQRMHNAAGRMQALISGLMTLSRVTTRAQGFEPVDLAKIVREVISDLEVQIEQAEARVDVGKMSSIQADPLQMRQLLQNLISNALKFHRPEEPLVVKVYGRFTKGRSERTGRESPAEAQCRIVVEDNGIGFEEKYAERIFGVFQRLHPRDVYRGTGIGLAICRKIVERHGGTITAESTPGRGSTFVVLLPVAHPKPKN